MYQIIMSYIEINRKQSATPEGRTILTNKFKLCKNLTKPEDIDEINGWIQLAGLYSI